MDNDVQYWMLEAMNLYGGSFVKNLSEAWQCADQFNSKKLEQAFPEIMKEYIEMGKRLQVLLKEKEKSNDS